MDKVIRHPVYQILILLLMLLIAAGCRSKSDRPEISPTVLQRQALDPKASLLLIEAEDAFLQGAYGVALMLADSVERYAPELADIPFLRGRAFTTMIRFDEAEAAYNKVLELDPYYQGVRLNLGSLAFRRGQFRKALDWYRKEQEAYPSAVVLLQMGRAYAELREADKAREAYLQAIAEDSSYVTVYFRLSELYKEEGELNKALEYSRRGLSLDPDNLNYQYFVGSLLLLTGEIEEAVDYLQTVVAQYPWHYWAHYNLGQALVRQGHQDEGQRYLARADSLKEEIQNIEEWQTLAEQNPDQFMLWVNLGEAYRQAGRIDEAIQAYQIAFNLGPQNLAVQTNLANMYLMRGDTSWAIAGYRLILRQDPSYAGAWFNLGVVYNSMGKLEDARFAFESALMYEPGDSATKAYLAELPDIQ